MDLNHVLDRWFGPLEHPPQRALFLGAGFSKACWGGAPTFADLVPEAQRRLSESRSPRPSSAHSSAESLIEGALDPAHNGQGDPSAVFEALIHAAGRVAAMEVVLAEPHGTGPRLEHPRNIVDCPLPHDVPSLARPLAEWRRCIRARLFGLPQLDPRGGVVVLGRLIAESAVDHVLTTNWDAYAELGCMLAGLQIRDEHDHQKRTEQSVGPAEPCGRVRVFEGASDVAQQERPQGHQLLFKLHGGVRFLSRLHRDLQSGDVSPSNAEHLLRRCFLVASSDLALWRGASEWVEAQVKDTLAGRSALFLGVSFADTATFMAVRRTIDAWEESARLDAQCQVLGRSPRSVGPPEQTIEGPRIAAVDYGPKLHTLNAVTLCPPQGDGAARSRIIPLAKGDAVGAVRVALARHLLEHVIRTLMPRRNRGPYLEAPSTSRSLEAAIEQGWEKLYRLVTQLPENPRLVRIVVDALAPSARWAALSEGAPPFRDSPHCDSGAKLTIHDAESSWWYAPWSVPSPGVEPAGASQGLVLVDALWRALEHGWEVAAEGEWLEHPSGARLWLWPWPWQWRDGLASQRLLDALSGPFATRIPPIGCVPPGLRVVPLVPEPLAPESWATEVLVSGSLCTVMPYSHTLLTGAPTPTGGNCD